MCFACVSSADESSENENLIQNHTETVNMYRKAAEQGDAEAQYNLGLM
ncbi:hypothetical protein THIOM_001240, partial [Candidatus Thiomargarita nelsonii]